MLEGFSVLEVWDASEGVCGFVPGSWGVLEGFGVFQRCKDVLKSTCCMSDYKSHICSQFQYPRVVGKNSTS